MITKQYFRDLWELARQEEGVPELSLRPATDRFLRNMAEEFGESVEVVFEPRKQRGAGHPDWRFHHKETLGTYGYVEAKPLDLEKYMDVTSYEEQVQKYLKLGHEVILTDGLEFVFYSPSEATTSRRVSLVSKPISLDALVNAEPERTLEPELRRFFKSPGFTSYSEQKLVMEAAKRARNMADEIRDLVSSPDGSGSDATENRLIAEMHELHGMVRNHHDPNLRDATVFADFVAQVLTFGLLYAHVTARSESDDPSVLYEKIGNFWSEDTPYEAYASRLRPFKAISRILQDSLDDYDNRSFGVWYDDCRRLLSHARLDYESEGRPSYHTLFEKFLDAFDSKMRFDYGAFYTPRELSEFVAGMAEAATELRFDSISLYDSENTLIDPCCGTGTFLEAMVSRIPEEAAKPRIVGFEILPAPYALAQYRLSMLSEDRLPPANTHVSLTNTLGNSLQEELPEEPNNAIAFEQYRAGELSRPPLMLVIGNPPCTDSSPRKSQAYFSEMRSLVDDFRPPPELRRARQNTQKQLNDDFVWFLRWSCGRLEASERGILALVLPSSFAEHVTYKYARKWLIEHCSDLWVLDLDEDGRRGIPSSSLFGTLQGRLLLVGTFSAERDERGAHRIGYANIIHMSTAEKREYLSEPREGTQYLEVFENFEVDRRSYRLRPSQSYDAETYAGFWPMYESQDPG